MTFLDVGLLQPRNLVLHVLGVQLEIVRLGAEEVEVGRALQDGLLVVAELRIQLVETVGGLWKIPGDLTRNSAGDLSKVNGIPA